jgi:hypothetical protein
MELLARQTAKTYRAVCAEVVAIHRRMRLQARRSYIQVD